MKVCALNFAKGLGYPQGQARLQQALKQHGFTGHFFGYREYYELGCPPHASVPYAFKPYAVLRALDSGYDVVYYFDASVLPVAPLDTLTEKITQDGHFMEDAGHSVGTWCKDAALKTLGITREEAFGMQLFIAGCFALDLRHEKSRQFALQWKTLADDGVTFPGSWVEHPSVSTDPRVKGHRHDMTAASVIANKLGMSFVPNNTYTAYPTLQTPSPTAIFHIKPA